ncbi:MAG: dTMP kinase [Proteobacteria bacterium]|nr:dTMP kinase [Pseudomonadota bacterium]
MTGKFITIEGSEGVGKTTNLKFVLSCLEQHGVTTLATREPGGTPLAEEVRSLLLQPREEKVSNNAELLLIFAARAQHLEQVIQPALTAGTWVVCDRFTDATYAYQGGGRGMDLATIALLENLVHPDLQPDLTLYLDLDPAIAAERISDRPLDRFEREQRTFFEAVRSQYLARAAASNRFAVIDAQPALVQVQAQIAQVIDRLFD